MKEDMEQISPVDQIKQTRKAEGAKPVDQVAISSEAHKIDEWVEMLKEMPDMREEAIMRATRAKPDLRKIAQSMIT